jgi:hypothetical protein
MQTAVVPTRVRQFWLAQSALRVPNTPSLLAHWQPATSVVMTEVARTIRCTIGQTFVARRLPDPVYSTRRNAVKLRHFGARNFIEQALDTERDLDMRLN